MDIEAYLREYFKKKGVKKAILFGSFARGDKTKKSDLDLIIIYDTEKRFFYRYEDFLELYDRLPYELDLLTYTLKEWGKIKDRLFFKGILKEAKVIYEQEKSTE